MTEPGARGTFSATVTQWAIFDAYEDERMNAQGAVGTGATATAASSTVTSIAGPVLSGSFLKASETSKVVHEERFIYYLHVLFCNFTVLTLPNQGVEEPRNFIPIDHKGRSGARRDSTALQARSSLQANLHILERMVVLNATMAVALDAKYWDDPADQYQAEGTQVWRKRIGPEAEL